MLLGLHLLVLEVGFARKFYFLVFARLKFIMFVSEVFGVSIDQLTFVIFDKEVHSSRSVAFTLSLRMSSDSNNS